MHIFRGVMKKGPLLSPFLCVSHLFLLSLSIKSCMWCRVGREGFVVSAQMPDQADFEGAAFFHSELISRTLNLAQSQGEMCTTAPASAGGGIIAVSHRGAFSQSTQLTTSSNAETVIRLRLTSGLVTRRWANCRFTFNFSLS